MKKYLKNKSKQPHWNHVGGGSVTIIAFGKVTSVEAIISQTRTAEKVDIATQGDGFYYFH